MGSTLAEKVLSRAAGRTVRAGEDVQARPDFVLAYIWPGSISDMLLHRAQREYEVDGVLHPERLALFIDHNTPSTNAASEALHQQVRDWTRRHGVALYDRQGIGHLVAAEQGYAVPGGFVVHFDPHVSQLGAFGTLAIGLQVGIVEAFVRETVSLRVPATVRVEFEGRLTPGVMARDVFHHLLRQLGSSGCRNAVLEFAGPGLEAFSIGDLQCMTGLSMFTGAVASVVEPTEAILAEGARRARMPLPVQRSDSDAAYLGVHRIDLAACEPMVVLPPSPANVERLVDHAGLRIDAGYVGSCASGRIEDLRAAAEVLRGRRVRPGFQLNVVPSSQAIMADAAREGLLGVFAEAGAFVSPPTCSYCYGGAGQLLAGQRALSTGTLNVRGRMGSADAEIVLASAASVAAAAIEGAVTDPRPLLAGAA